MSSLEIGKKAPPFTLEDQNGEKVKLSQFSGQYVVLYFYPKDNTPGCTTEACDFRDHTKKFEKANAVVLGVSPDAASSHQKFIKKFDLPFRLLVDEQHEVAEKYGVWGEKSLYGKKFMGIIRSTFLIGPDGKIVSVWSKVKIDGHVAEVLKALKSSSKH